MDTARHRFAISLAVGAIWVAITIFAEPRHSQETRSLYELVSQGIGPQFMAACLFLLAVAAAFRSRDIGFHRPQPAGSVLLLWFPALYLVVFISLALKAGLPTPQVILFIFVNTMLVGLSEELMFRGILFQGILSRLPVWPAIWLTSIVFGAIHSLNAFFTGDLTAALVQSVAAFMSGILFIAIRIRTASLYPPIVFHGLWDFCMFLSLGPAGGEQTATGPSGFMLLIPIAFVLPNFLYGLFLMRKVSQETYPSGDAASAR